MKLKIKVTEDHIARGKKGSCGKCPIALAILDAGFKAVFVGAAIEASRYKTKSKFWLANERLFVSDKDMIRIDKFINKFDADLKVKPFQFTVELTDVQIKNLKFTPAQAA